MIIGRDGHIGMLFAAAAVPIMYWLLFRSTLGFEIRTVGANPDAARYAGMQPRRLIVLTMSISGLLAGLAGTVEILGELHHIPAAYSTTVGFDAIAVALLGRSHPVGILFAALLFGAMRAGSGLMQIRAGIPVQMIGVLQAVILFFLAAPVVVRKLFRVGGDGVATSEMQTITRSYATRRRSSRWTSCTASPSSDTSSSSSAALIDVLPIIAPTIVAAAVPIALGALCGFMNERSGVINIGIEGMMLTAAFVAWWTASIAAQLVPAARSASSASRLPLLIGLGGRDRRRDAR